VAVIVAYNNICPSFSAKFFLLPYSQVDSIKYLIGAHSIRSMEDILHHLDRPSTQSYAAYILQWKLPIFGVTYNGLFGIHKVRRNEVSRVFSLRETKINSLLIHVVK